MRFLGPFERLPLYCIKIIACFQSFLSVIGLLLSLSPFLFTFSFSVHVHYTLAFIAFDCTLISVCCWFNFYFFHFFFHFSLHILHCTAPILFPYWFIFHWDRLSCPSRSYFPFSILLWISTFSFQLTFTFLMAFLRNQISSILN